MADQKANLSETNSPLSVAPVVLNQQPHQPPADIGNSESAFLQQLRPPPENQDGSIHLVRASIPSPLLQAHHPGTERLLSLILDLSSQPQSFSHPPNTPPQFHHANSWPSSNESPSSDQVSRFRHASSLPVTTLEIENNYQQQSATHPKDKQPTPQQKPATLYSSSGLGVPGAAKKKNSLATTASNLAYLLPTGTVLAFQTLIPSLSNNGKCQVTNMYLVGSVIACCAITCFLCSFTDSFLVENKVFYGIATFHSFYIFGEHEENVKHLDLDLKKYKIGFADVVHALGSVIVFLVFAFTSTEVIDCFFAGEGGKEYSVILVYLPLLAGMVSTLCFSILPVNRQGIGYGFLTCR